MMLRDLFRQLSWHRRSDHGVSYESAETALERELSEADEQDPNWDLESRISSAASLLRRKTPPELVKRTYGSEVFKAAVRSLGFDEIMGLIHYDNRESLPSDSAPLFGPEFDQLDEPVRIVEAADILQRQVDASDRVRQVFGTDNFVAALTILDPGIANACIDVVTHSVGADEVPELTDALYRGESPMRLRRAFGASFFLASLVGIRERGRILDSYILHSFIHAEDGTIVSETSNDGEKQKRLIEAFELLRKGVSAELVERAYGHSALELVLPLVVERRGSSNRRYSAA